MSNVLLLPGKATARLANMVARRKRRRPPVWFRWKFPAFSSLAPLSPATSDEDEVEAQKRAAAAPELPDGGYDAESLRAIGVVKRSMQLGARTVLLTGAGFSTESGVPDYRSQKGSYSKGHKPMQHQEFLAKGEKGEANRRRYWVGLWGRVVRDEREERETTTTRTWRFSISVSPPPPPTPPHPLPSTNSALPLPRNIKARSVIGWTHMDGTRPNSGHRDAAKLQAAGYLEGGIITQNVDGLHTVAGAKGVAELHGNLHEVVCSGEGGACAWVWERLSWGRIHSPTHSLTHSINHSLTYSLNQSLTHLLTQSITH